MTTPTKIIIADYDPLWPILFQQERDLLLKKLSNSDSLIIEHIGSTSIFGLSAKPVIDTSIALDSLEDVDQPFISALESIGYEYVPEYEKEIPERRYFRKNSREGVRTHQIHVAEKKSAFHKRHLLFRDYLRNHPQLASEYATLKRTLAKQFTDTQEYARAKSDFINKVLDSALKS